MATMTGRGSGLFEAATKLEGLAQGRQEQQRLRDLADSDLKSEALSRDKGKLELQAYQQQRAQEEADFASEQKAKELLATAQVNAGKEAAGDSWEAHLKRSALTNLDAGKEMLKYNYSKGIDLMNKGHDFEKQMHTATYEQLQRNLVKNQLVAEAFANVSDQSSLDQALNDAARMGVPIPPKYQKWNVETSQWVQRKALASETMKTRIKAEKDMAETAYQRASAQAKQEDNKLKEAKEKREEQLARSKLNPMLKPTKDSMKADKQFAEVLDTQSAAFKGLPSNTKQVVVRDIGKRALELMRKDLNLGEVEATKMASEEILTKIKEDPSVLDMLPFTTPNTTYESTALGDSNAGSIETKPQFEEGKVYTDANGNKAKYVKGKWVPQ